MPTPADTLSPDTLCIACGYSLRGIADDGKCPGCGTSAVVTRAGGPLASVSSRVLRRKRLAAALVGIGMISGVLIEYGFRAAVMFIPEDSPSPQWFDLTETICTAAVLALIAFVPTAAGLYLPVLLPRANGRPRRWLTRAAMSLCVCVAVFLAACEIANGVAVFRQHVAMMRSEYYRMAEWERVFAAYLPYVYVWLHLVVGSAISVQTLLLARLRRSRALAIMALASLSLSVWQLSVWLIRRLLPLSEQDGWFVYAQTPCVLVFAASLLLAAREISRELRSR